MIIEQAGSNIRFMTRAIDLCVQYINLPADNSSYSYYHGKNLAQFSVVIVVVPVGVFMITSQIGTLTSLLIIWNEGTELVRYDLPT